MRGIEPSRRERRTGVALFLVVTACWMLGLVSAEQDWIEYSDFLLVIAVVLSAATVVVTGYLRRIMAAVWLGWIPGATMMAIGFSMTPTPGGDEAGGGMVFIGGLVLAFGWPAYFLPLIALGAVLRGRRAGGLPSARGRFDHVTIRVADREASERFYDTVLATLGIDQTHGGEDVAEWNDFSLTAASYEHPVTRGLHIGFFAPSRDHVDEFWRVGTEAGYRGDGAPGPRPKYSSDYYGAFLLDPDGNSAEAVNHQSGRTGGIDHLWIRVADLGAAKRFYDTVAPQTGFRLKRELADRAHFAGASGSFSVVAGTPTEHAHLAFRASENSTVDEFHRAATAAGYRDNGPPGEPPIYHRGYYAAFVLDPDGNNVEVVNHNRR